MKNAHVFGRIWGLLFLSLAAVHLAEAVGPRWRLPQTEVQTPVQASNVSRWSGEGGTATDTSFQSLLRGLPFAPSEVFQWGVEMLPPGREGDPLRAERSISVRRFLAVMEHHFGEELERGAQAFQQRELASGCVRWGRVLETMLILTGMQNFFGIERADRVWQGEVQATSRTPGVPLPAGARRATLAQAGTLDAWVLEMLRGVGEGFSQICFGGHLQAVATAQGLEIIPDAGGSIWLGTSPAPVGATLEAWRTVLPGWFREKTRVARTSVDPERQSLLRFSYGRLLGSHYDERVEEIRAQWQRIPERVSESTRRCSLWHLKALAFLEFPYLFAPNDPRSAQEREMWEHLRQACSQ